MMTLLVLLVGQISGNYPGDAGIENHPDVVYVEKFDDATLSSVTARYTEVLNAAGMMLDSDVPAGSPGGRSLRITATGGSDSGGHLYRNLPAGDVWHVRYYVKYFSGGPYHHTGMWFGGYNPATPWPNPQAGTRPAGDDRISVSFEPVGGSRLDHYVYWMHMRGNPNPGTYWGNDFIQDSSLTFPSGQWMCVEIRVRLNTPVTSYNGELACWVNGVPVSNLGLGYPNGGWVWDSWTPDPGGDPFEGFQWRNDANLALNYLWIEHYADTVPAGQALAVKYDHIVIARSYIGPMVSAAGAPAPGGGGGDGDSGCGSVGLDLMLPLFALLAWRGTRKP